MQIDFYVYNIHEVTLWEPLWKALQERSVDARFVVEPPDLCTAMGSRPDKAQGYRDVKTRNIERLMTPEAHNEITALLQSLGCGFELRGRYNADAVVTTQGVGWLRRYRGLKFRTMYGVGATRDSYGHGRINAGMDAVFVHGKVSRDAIAAHVPADAIFVTGFPKYAGYLRGGFPTDAWHERFALDPAKQTLTYLPTWAHNSSLERFPAAIARLAKRFNVLCKPHHNNLHFERERIEPLLQAEGVRICCDVRSIVPFLACADVVLADVRSGAFTEALLLDRPTVGLSPHGEPTEDNLIAEAYRAAHVCLHPADLAALVEETASGDTCREERRLLARRLFADLAGKDDAVTAEAMIAAVSRHTEAAPSLVERIQEGERLYGQGDLTAACYQFLEAVKQDPRQPEAWNNLGVTLDAMGEFEEAARALHRSLEITPEDAQTLTNLAKVLLHQHKLTDASIVLRRALAVAPEDLHALSLRGEMGLL